MSDTDEYFADVMKNWDMIVISEHYQIVLFIVLLQCMFYF